MVDRETSNVRRLFLQALSEALLDCVKSKFVCATSANPGREARLDLQVLALEVLQRLIHLPIIVDSA